MAASTCINCKQEVNASFCPNCGQPNPPHRITFPKMWGDFQSRIYGFDGMFPRTLKDLTIRPGLVAKEYVEGNRVKYYGAVGYFFLMLTVMLLLMSLLQINFYEYSMASNSFMKATSAPSIQTGQKHMAEFVGENMKLLAFLIIPFLAIYSRLIFRKAKLNVFEHSVLPFFVSGHFYWISIVNLFVYKISGTVISQMILLVTFIIFYGFAVAGFYKDKSNKSKTVRFFAGVLVFALSYITFSIMAAGAGIIYAYNHPELFLPPPVTK